MRKFSPQLSCIVLFTTVALPLLRSGPAATLKKSKSGEPGNDAAGNGEGEGFCCLIRATDGKKKISAALLPAQVARFNTAFTLVQKAHMDSLKVKKKEKKKAPPKKKAQPATRAGRLLQESDKK